VKTRVFGWELPYGSNERLKWILYKKAFQYCDHVIFVSHNQSKYWLIKNKMRVKDYSVIQNGIEIKNFNGIKLSNGIIPNIISAHKIRKHKLLVGICALLRPEKKHSDLLRAIHELRMDGIDVGLMIIGDGPEMKKLKRLILRYELSDAVYLTGYQQDVKPYIFLCDCMVISSHAIETFSISVLESMAMAKPVIMTDIGGASEQIDHGVNGYLYNPGDIETLKDKIVLLLDSVLRSKMAQNAKNKVTQNFTSEIMLNKYETVLHDQISKSIISNNPSSTSNQ
jgi:glycosyltransferase involved in cell wall biosynthesis